MQDNIDYHLVTKGAIYVLGLGPDAGNRLVRRVDDGSEARRIEPEVLIGAHEAFVYFSIGGQLRRARTGISTGQPGEDSWPPEEVSGLVVTRFGADLEFSWAPVTRGVLGNPENVGPYEVWRSLAADFSDGEFVQETSDASTSLTIPGEGAPESAALVFYQVRARDAAGNLGE
jgi:hypothetical protein